MRAGAVTALEELSSACFAALGPASRWGDLAKGNAEAIGRGEPLDSGHIAWLQNRAAAWREFAGATDPDLAELARAAADAIEALAKSNGTYAEGIVLSYLEHVCGSTRWVDPGTGNVFIALHSRVGPLHQLRAEQPGEAGNLKQGHWLMNAQYRVKAIVHSDFTGGTDPKAEEIPAP